MGAANFWLERVNVIGPVPDLSRLVSPNLNRDTGLRRFQPVLAIINLQSTQFASIIAPRTGRRRRRPVSRVSR
jgi:hypothetical protein